MKNKQIRLSAPFIQSRKLLREQIAMMHRTAGEIVALLRDPEFLLVCGSHQAVVNCLQPLAAPFGSTVEEMAAAFVTLPNVADWAGGMPSVRSRVRRVVADDAIKEIAGNQSAAAYKRIA
jgi:hypothetical protein